MGTYVYTSEGGHGQRTFVATCPYHARDLSIHPNRHKAGKVADAHWRMFHSPGQTFHLREPVSVAIP